MEFARSLFVNLHDGTGLDELRQWLKMDALYGVPSEPSASPVSVPAAAVPRAEAEPEAEPASVEPPGAVLLTDPVSWELVAALAAQVAADANDVELVDGLGAWQRSMGFATSRMHVQMAELYARRVGLSLQRLAAARAVGGRRDLYLARRDVDLDAGGVENEIALALSWSRSRAGRALAIALTLTSRMTQTLDALAAGDIEAKKAEVMATDMGTALSDDDLVARVEEQVLPKAQELTIPALRELIKETILRVAPELAAERAAKARARRGVSFYPEPDDMIRVEALMGADEGMAFITALDKVTHVAKTAGDPRTSGQVRVDTMVDAVVQAAEDIIDAAYYANDDSSGSPEDPDRPGDPDDCVRDVEDEIAQADPRTPDPDGPVDGSADPGPPRPHRAAKSPGRERGGERHGERARRGPRIRRALKHEVNVTVPLETLTGAADYPGYLARYGPITAGLAREMAGDAAREGYWRCVVTDDVHGTLLGMGKSTFTPAYQAPVYLQRYLNLRDRVCDFPGCRHAAVLSEFDHHVPHPVGATCECNGRKRCRHHHRLKHETAWQVSNSDDRRDPPGTSVWTTPAGKTYANRPPVVGVPAPRTNLRPSPEEDSGPPPF